MLTVKTALRAKGVGATALTTKLGGQHIYQSDQEIDIAALITGGAAAVVIFTCVTDAPDVETGYVAQVYQFDVFAQTADLADEVAELLTDTYAWRHGVASGTLTGLVGRRLAEPVTATVGPRDMPREPLPAPLHRRSRSFKVATYPAC